MVAIIVITGAVYLLAHSPRTASPSQSSVVSQKQAIPPLTPAVEAQLAKSHGFQYLVSYTNNGFEPSNISIKKGETIRFTNNSSGDVWIAATATGGALYPNVANGCGSSAFDSCHALKSGEFWEFTFESAGTWSYADNLHKDKTGVVHVK